MTGNVKDAAGEQLTLQSRLSELAQVSPWIERLAAQHKIPDKTQFAMNLCLEEVLSNIVQHGYSGQPDRSISLRFTCPNDSYFVIVVEDHAPPFNPVDASVPPPLSALDGVQVGGQGIRLLRQFADELEFQPLPNGNRLSIGFGASDSAIAKG